MTEKSNKKSSKNQTKSMVLCCLTLVVWMIALVNQDAIAFKLAIIATVLTIVYVGLTGFIKLTKKLKDFADNIQEEN